VIFNTGFRRSCLYQLLYIETVVEIDNEID